MNTFNCEQFVYNKADFERDIMKWFEGLPPKALKGVIDDSMDKPKCFKTSVLKRIIKYKTNQNNWWIDEFEALTPFEKAREQEEMIEIWKMGIMVARTFYTEVYTKKENYEENAEDDEETLIQKAVDSWFYDALAESEEKLEKGEINENQYLIRCKNMKAHKEQTEELFNVCTCTVLCRQNRGRVNGEDADLLRFMCLPCGFLN